MNAPKAIKVDKSHISVPWYKLPYVDVSSVEEYFSLPKTKREKFGLYLRPFALPWEIFKSSSQEKGWDFFYSEIKKQYPLQWFFRHWLFDFDNPCISIFYKYVFWPWKDFKYAVKRWFNPCHPRWRKSLLRHQYKDIQELVVVSNFALIRDFYWEEVVEGFVDWQADVQHREFYDQLVANVRWIEDTFPKLDEKYYQFLSEASKTEGDYHTKYKNSNAIEKEIEDHKTEILTWFIKNRHFFWT